MKRRAMGFLLMVVTSMGVAAQERRPDLTVVGTRVEGGRVTATVANRGAVAPAIRARTTLFANGASFDAVTPALGPGQTAEIAFANVLAAGTVYQVMVDSARQVEESNETNNRTLNATVPARGVAVDPSLARAVRDRRLPRFEDGQPRTAAVARFPGGDLVPFVENELLLTTNDAGKAKALAARWGGSVVRTIARPAATGRGPTFVVRVNASKAPEQAFTAREDGFAFSSEAARTLLAIAAVERKAGVRVGLNLLFEPAGYFEKSTADQFGENLLALDYMQTGGALDVNVADAWKALFHAGKTAGKPITIGIVDSGFALNTPAFVEGDLDVLTAIGTGGSNKGDCGTDNPCPWHGHSVALAAAAIPDNMKGAAGPGGPVARIVAIDTAYTLESATEAVMRAHDEGAQIINMSFGSKVPRDEGWFSGAWPESLDEFEKDTVWLNTAGGRLVFASAGNDGDDVDAKNGDGLETHWYAPCENQGVLCVGGWIGAPSKQIGVLPDGGSNFSSGGGEGVDLFGPWATKIGALPNSPGVKFAGGTSIASPFVAGVAALIWAANPQQQNWQVRDLLLQHAIVVNPNMRRVHAYGPVRAALLTNANVGPRVTITAVGTDGTLKQTKMKLTASAYDIEDQNCCQNAQWTIDGKFVGKGMSIDHDFSQDTKAGAKLIRVTVTDSGGLTATDSVLKFLNNDPPTVKITGSPQKTLAAGEGGAFHAQVLDDVGIAGNIPVQQACAKLQWKEGGTLRATGCDAVFAFGTPGTRTVTASYTDPHGAAASDSVSVSVKAADPGKPTVTIIAPIDDTRFTLSETIPAKATVSNFSGLVTRIWTLTNPQTGKTKPVVLQNDAFRIQDVFPDMFDGPAEEKMTLTLTVTTTAGQTSDPKSVTIVKRALVH